MTRRHIGTHFGACADASPVVRAVFDDIKATRKVDDVSSFWKHLANDPAMLRRT